LILYQLTVSFAIGRTAEVIVFQANPIEQTMTPDSSPFPMLTVDVSIRANAFKVQAKIAFPLPKAASRE
jgi:hypothetical protein